MNGEARRGVRARRLGAAALMPLAVLLVATACAEEPLPDATAAIEADTDGQLTLRGAEEEDGGRQWFWFAGTSNYRVKLEASEKKIDRMLNRPGRLLFRGWDDPATFKDWSDDGLIWDLWAGVGFEINKHVSWALYGGGGMGTVKNRDHYRLLGVPVGLRADFTRRSFFLGTSWSFYPWGRPERQGPGLMGSLRGARPVFEANVGFNYQYSLGDVSFSLPLLGRVLHVEDQEEFYLFFVGPRGGVEFPVNDRTTFNIIAGAVWFHDAGDDFNNVLLEFFVRRRF